MRLVSKGASRVRAQNIDLFGEEDEFFQGKLYRRILRVALNVGTNGGGLEET